MSIEPRTEPTPPDAPDAPPDVDFNVLGARRVKYAAAPMLTIDLQVSEPAGREVYMVALTIQLMIEPARRSYDDATRDRLVEAGLERAEGFSWARTAELTDEE